MKTFFGEKYFVKLFVLILSGFVKESNEFTGLENGPAVSDAGILGNLGAEVGQNGQRTNVFVYVATSGSFCSFVGGLVFNQFYKSGSFQSFIN